MWRVHFLLCYQFSYVFNNATLISWIASNRFRAFGLMASSTKMQIHTHMSLGMELVLWRPSVYKTTILLKSFQVREVLPNFFTKNGNVSFHEFEDYYVACKVHSKLCLLSLVWKISCLKMLFYTFFFLQECRFDFFGMYFAVPENCFADPSLRTTGLEANTSTLSACHPTFWAYHGCSQHTSIAKYKFQASVLYRN